MRKIFMAALAALITVPGFAQQKKPTPTATSKRQGEVKPASGPAAKSNPDSSKSNRLRGRVLSQQGRMFTIISDGKKITLSGARLKELPRVGETVDITYTQTPGGPLEATTVKSSKSNSSE